MSRPSDEERPIGDEERPAESSLTPLVVGRPSGLGRTTRDGRACHPVDTLHVSRLDFRQVDGCRRPRREGTMAERKRTVDPHPDHLSRRQWPPSAAALGIATVAARPEPAWAQLPGGSPKPGGTSVWAAETDPVALNPITNSNFSSTQGFEHCYESLTAFDAKAQIVPALAERWDTPNPTTYVFHLRRGVKFHDGSELTAEDVKYTFDIVLDPKGPAFWRGHFDQ